MTITINTDKAKAIWKDNWRAARATKLQALDVAYLRAVEQGDTARIAEIAAQKQALRDVTQIEIPGSTPEEIKSVWPEILN